MVNGQAAAAGGIVYVEDLEHSSRSGVYADNIGVSLQP